jgi:hypothetical protein
VDRVPEPNGHSPWRRTAEVTELPERRPPNRTLNTEEMDRVIGRALDLQVAGSERDRSAGVDEEELLRIGSEVGIEARYLRRALGEVRAELMIPDLPTDREILKRLGGYGFVRASRVVLSPLEDGFTLVTLTADMRNQRSEQVGGGGGIAGFVGAEGGLALGIGAGMPWLAVPGLVVGAGFGGWLGRREYRKQIDRMELSLEGLLDRLEAGEPLAPPGRRASRFLERLSRSDSPPRRSGRTY